jgi:hypothetical protein
MRRWAERALEALRRAGVSERGLVTVEWVAITAAVVVPAVLLTWFVMEVTDGLAGDERAVVEEVGRRMRAAVGL